MPTALLIANPVAARTDDTARRRVVEYLATAGWRTEVAITAGPSDAREFAARGVAERVDAVAVLGGDGTTMQAAASLAGSGVPLALIPGGTGNLLAGNLGIPLDPVDAARTLVRGRPRAIDLGRVVLPDGAHYFGVACGAGIDAHVMGSTRTEDKRRWGIGAYLATTFRSLPLVRSTRCRIVVDDEEFDADAALVLIMNCGQMIPGVVQVLPEIQPDDGVLNLLAFAADTPWQGLRGLLRVMLNNANGITETPYLRYARGRRFRVEPAEPLEVQFDGDPVGMTPFTAEVVPAALSVMTPAT